MKSIIALMAGILLPFAFAPYELYPLAVFSLFILLYTWEKANPREALWMGFLYGIGCFGKGVYWIYISIHEFGNSSLWLASLITLLFVSILSLFTALNSYIFKRYFFALSHIKLSYWLAFPATWALTEWLRSWIFTGFPWLLLGHSQTNSPLRGFIPVMGVYGVSFIIALSAGLLYTLLRTSQRKCSLGLFIFIWLSGIGLTYIHWTKSLLKPIHVTLIQGNIPQSIKWSAAQALDSLGLYQDLTRQYWPAQSGGLVIWPETAVTLFLEDAAPLLKKVDLSARQKHIGIITGIPLQKADNYYNGAIVLGEGEGYYYKRHLVPFGEYTPFKKILGKLLDILQLPMSDFIEGPKQQPLMKVQDNYIGLYICYEIAYSHLLRTDLPKANILVTISNDSWFGQSSALGQQRQISQFAAQSTGRYMLVATNSGETVVINPEGKILAQAPIDKTAVVESTIEGMTGSTPWVRWGNLPFIGLLIIFLIILRIYYSHEN